MFDMRRVDAPVTSWCLLWFSVFDSMFVQLLLAVSLLTALVPPQPQTRLHNFPPDARLAFLLAVFSNRHTLEGRHPSALDRFATICEWQLRNECVPLLTGSLQMCSISCCVALHGCCLCRVSCQWCVVNPDSRHEHRISYWRRGGEDSDSADRGRKQGRLLIGEQQWTINFSQEPQKQQQLLFKKSSVSQHCEGNMHIRMRACFMFWNASRLVLTRSSNR